jgi:hypothetical protein
MGLMHARSDGAGSQCPAPSGSTQGRFHRRSRRPGRVSALFTGFVLAVGLGVVPAVLAVPAVAATSDLPTSSASLLDAGLTRSSIAGPWVVPAQAGEGLDPGAAGTGEGGGEGVRTGPDPTGQPLPDRSQRIIDSAVWLGLLAALAVAVVAVARSWWASPSVRPLLDRDDLDGPSATEAGTPETSDDRAGGGEGQG